MKNKTTIEFGIGQRVIRSGAVVAALLACLGANAQVSGSASATTDNTTGVRAGSSGSVDSTSGVSGSSSVSTDRSSTDRFSTDRNSTDRSSSRGDSSFIKEAAKGGLMEVKMGQLGADRAENSQIKSFGERLVKDHTKANEELMSIAQSKGVDLTKDMDHTSHDMTSSFSSKSGSEFDKAYIKHMVTDHQKDISKFEREASRGTDAEVKAFAQKTLPTLREHLRMAQDIARTIGVETASGVSATGTSSSDNSAAGAGASVSTDRDQSNPRINTDTQSGAGKSQGSVNIHTGEPGDGKTLGVTTREGDGKTLGLNTDKNDGKLLGVVADPLKKDHSASASVNTSSGHSARVNANVDTGSSSSTSYDRNGSVSASTDSSTKSKVFSTDKNDGKLWGIFPAPSHKNRGPGASVNVDTDNKSVDLNANTGSAGSAPSSSSGSARSNR